MKIQRRRMSKKVILAIVIACIIAGIAAYLVLAQPGKSNQKPRKPITYSGPSEQDIKDAEDENSAANKREEIETEKTTTSSKKQQVTPIITNADFSGQQLSVNSYISGIFEDGGTCTLTAIKGSASVTRTAKGFADATTTGCPPFFVDKSAFAETGSWNITVSYSSTKAEGKSQSTTVNIQ